MPTVEAVLATRPDSVWAERRGDGARTRAAAREDNEATNEATGGNVSGKPPRSQWDALERERQDGRGGSSMDTGGRDD